ncbi:MAG TPA: hypothetical protein VKV28_17345 [Candidatus Binataceae bacterium]|nr:hypothetical protein [Candidatus Binataceae bacterium]
MADATVWVLIALVATLSASAGFCTRLILESRARRKRAIPYTGPPTIDVAEIYQRIGQEIVRALNEHAKGVSTAISMTQQLHAQVGLIAGPLERIAAAAEARARQGNSLNTSRAPATSDTPAASPSLDPDYPERRSRELLSSLADGGWQAAESTIQGLRRLEAEGLRIQPLVTAEDKWLLIAVSLPGCGDGVVVPTLATVIGPVALAPWYECQGCDGTTPLTLRDVSVLARAHRELPDGEWRVSKKGLLRREPA